ncbi:MAG: peptidase M16 [Ignavibacteriae bacterium]|nr:MAG: peptidase M16 [Ignavibacteriota bacterium]
MNKYKLTKLSNGIRVATEKIEHVNSFSLGFWFNVGSRDETKKNNGISHFLEHMFFKGTKRRTARRISEEIESVGGYLNAFTSKEHTCLYGRGMDKHLKKTFLVLADMVQDSLFSEKELRKEAGVIIDELNDIEDSPEELIFDKFETKLYEGNKLSMPIIGTKENILNFTSLDLKNYVAQNYKADNFCIVASGNIEHDVLLNLTEKYLTKINSVAPKRRKYFNRSKNQDSFFYKNINQAHLIIGGTTYGYNSEQRAVSSLISNILGDGSSSRLFQALRERNGIAYQVNSFLNSFYDVSSIGVYLSTNEESIKKGRDIVFRELQKFKEKGVKTKELERAKEYIKGNIQLSIESTTNRMMRMANSLFYFKRIKEIEESLQNIDAITEEQIYEEVQIIFDNSNISTTLLASKNLLN